MIRRSILQSDNDGTTKNSGTIKSATNGTEEISEMRTIQLKIQETAEWK